MAVFTTDYSGIQLNFQQGVSPTIQNAGDARIKGAELEVSLVPNRIFRLDGSIGIIDAEYTSVLPQSQVAAEPACRPACSRAPTCRRRPISR